MSEQFASLPKAGHQKLEVANRHVGGLIETTGSTKRLAGKGLRIDCGEYPTNGDEEDLEKTNQSLKFLPVSI